MADIKYIRLPMASRYGANLMSKISSIFVGHSFLTNPSLASTAPIRVSNGLFYTFSSLGNMRTYAIIDGVAVQVLPYGRNVKDVLSSL